jgi:hypothetical protein
MVLLLSQPMPSLSVLLVVLPLRPLVLVMLLVLALLEVGVGTEAGAIVALESVN